MRPRIWQEHSLTVAARSCNSNASRARELSKRLAKRRRTSETRYLVIAVCHEVGHAQQRTLIRRLWKLADDLTSLVSERLRPILHPFDPAILLQQGQNPGEGDLGVVALFEYGLDQTPFRRCGALQRID